jgi:hypothetical protein
LESVCPIYGHLCNRLRAQRCCFAFCDFSTCDESPRCPRNIGLSLRLGTLLRSEIYHLRRGTEMTEFSYAHALLAAVLIHPLVNNRYIVNSAFAKSVRCQVYVVRIIRHRRNRHDKRGVPNGTTRSRTTKIVDRLRQCICPNSSLIRASGAPRIVPIFAAGTSNR